MEPKERYELMVKRGREIVKTIREMDSKIYAHQIDIAKMATAVCNIRHGGISTNIYTIKNYAEDINLAYKTVQSWVSIYRNVAQKLDKKIKTKTEWKHATTTNNLLKHERINENKNSGQRPGSRYGSKIQVPKEKVRDVFKSVQTGTGQFLRDIIRAHQSSKHVLYTIINGDLGLIHDRELTALMNTLDEASEIINEHLTNKEKIKKGA